MNGAKNDQENGVPDYNILYLAGVFNTAWDKEVIYAKVFISS